VRAFSFLTPKPGHSHRAAACIARGLVAANGATFSITRPRPGQHISRENTARTACAGPALFGENMRYLTPSFTAFLAVCVLATAFAGLWLRAWA
jgi:hypothetical protein